VVLSENKICVQCKNSLAVSQFYKKGKFWDSCCKICVLKKKKSKYLNSKKPNDATYKNIIIMPDNSQIDINMDELVDALESFLIEEFKNGQARSLER
jgi:hypothetical protein